MMDVKEKYICSARMTFWDPKANEIMGPTQMEPPFISNKRSQTGALYLKYERTNRDHYLKNWVNI